MIDVGANIGCMTLLAARAAGPSGIVFSFEPHPDIFAVLEHNVAAARRLPASAGVGPSLVKTRDFVIHIVLITAVGDGAR